MQIVDNSGGISSGSANITIPGLEKLKDLLTKFNSDTTPKKPLNTHAELYKNILPKEQQTEFILSKKPQNTIDKSDNTIPKKSKNSVLNIEFKPDETDEYKFTPSEFEAALVYNEIGYSRYADKNGNIYIEVMTSYLSAPGNNYDYRYNIYKYDKDGKFIGTAKDVKESDALLFHRKPIRGSVSCIFPLNIVYLLSKRQTG